MNKLINKFEYGLSDAAEEIERLREDIRKARGKKEKKDLTNKAQDLINAYEAQTGIKVWNKL